MLSSYWFYMKLTHYYCRYASKTSSWWPEAGKTTTGAKLRQCHHLFQVGQRELDWQMLFNTLVFECSRLFAAISLVSLTCPVAARPTRLWTSSTSCTPLLMTSSTTMMSTKWKPLEMLVSHLHVTWWGVKYIVNILSYPKWQALLAQRGHEPKCSGMLFNVVM